MFGRPFNFLLVLLIIGCSSSKDTLLQDGIWRATIAMQGQELPFNFEVTHENKRTKIYIINAGERIALDEVIEEGDSLLIPLHIFDASLKVKYSGKTLNGYFIKHNEKDYKLPFNAEHGKHFRFHPSAASSTTDFSGKYAVNFIRNQDTTKAVAIFQQHGDSVTGTFLTKTGDYRYLQGNVVNNELQLSAFDGNHAYLFTAIKEDANQLNGKFYSGKSSLKTWIAKRDEHAKLVNEDSVTFLDEGIETISFAFPDVDGKLVSLEDSRFKNKVIIVQILGTWCPNCMDETKFLTTWYEANRKKDIEIIGLAYEQKDDLDYARKRVIRMKEKLSVPYTILLAGSSDKEKRSQTLPMLKEIVAFPTTIFIDRNKRIAKIKTGFSGPGTGIYYEQFKEDFNNTINQLLKN